MHVAKNGARPIPTDVLNGSRWLSGYLDTWTQDGIAPVGHGIRTAQSEFFALPVSHRTRMPGSGNHVTIRGVQKGNAIEISCHTTLGGWETFTVEIEPAPPTRIERIPVQHEEKNARARELSSVS